MKTISYTRIRLLWSRLTLNRRKYLLTTFLGMLSVLYAIRLTGLLTDVNMNYYTYMYFAAFCVYMAVCMANTFSEMKTKRQRIGFLALPATTAEKFIVYSSWHVVIPVLLFAIALPGSEVPGALSVRLWGDMAQKATQTFVLPILVRDALVYISMYPDDSLFITLLGLFAFSLFLLGSCIWYKNVFLKTAAAIGSGILLLLFGELSLERMIRHLGMEDYTWQIIRDFDIPYPYNFRVAVITLCIGIVFLWWLSYKLFTRREVISQKGGWRCFSIGRK